ncbi:MAG: hypothetical protein ACXVRI_07600 [Gaiellaceae bacterium]
MAGAALITIVSRSEDLPGSGSGAGQVGRAVVIHPHSVATSPSSVALRLSTTLAPVLSAEPTTLEAYEVGSSGLEAPAVGEGISDFVTRPALGARAGVLGAIALAQAFQSR